MQHPFQKIPANRRKPVFVAVLVLTLAVMWVLSTVDEPLKTDAAPQGIISYELAGSISCAQKILDSWDASAQALAAWRALMREQVRPEVERRGFVYLRADLDRLDDADYFDHNHLNSRGIATYSRLLAPLLAPLLTSPAGRD